MDSPCIYIMYWDINCPYIGQSVHYEKRKRSHYNAMTRGDHDNYKIQKYYNTLKIYPTVEILVHCSLQDLNPLEEVLIKEFNSIDSGLNIISGGYSVGYGTNNPASIYTKEQLVEVLTLLVDPLNSYKNITEKTGVSKDTISKIVSGSHHLWLSEEYPDLYTKMKSTDPKLRYSHSASALAQGKKYKRIMDPLGNVYEVTNTLEFSNKHNLPNGNLCSVLLGKRNTVKGWKGIE